MSQASVLGARVGTLVLIQVVMILGNHKVDGGGGGGMTRLSLCIFLPGFI